ncbi:ATP-binding cassette domain-containing protein [Catenuloplanes sp. NPDC051500]|uniref:ATP-binding cassette domain-containing protein n=1 Tax=Catenuloplanes sp. NPDC051500 TaxID=3363959 RepID=UPI0037B659AB
MPPVIEIAGLRKEYRRLRGGTHRALDGFDMVVEPGQVHGFLGPNGSGKTTTLRALLGLVRADAGEMRILGQQSPSALPRVIGRVGAIVESPQFFGNISGRRLLTLLATAGGVPVARVDEVLTQVGLRDRGKDIVKTYSLGMKQRLAVASALLKAPELLILDEPANGLDPAGIREMRDLVRLLASQGVTVLVSSHILAEIQLICDSVTIISRGRRVLAGPVSGVLASFDAGDFRVRVAELSRAVEVLRAAGMRVTPAPDHLVAHGLAEPARLTELLGGQGLWISELAPLTPDLESVFLQLTATGAQPGGDKQVTEPAPNQFAPEVPR